MKRLLMVTLLTGPSWAVPNYSGNWQLDSKASQLATENEGPPTPTTIEVRLQTPELVIKPEHGDVQTYKLDGQKVPFKMSANGPMGMKLSGSGFRMGELNGESMALSERVRVSTPMGELSMRRDHFWTLIDGENTLVIESTAQTPRGQQRSRLVFRRGQQ